jgi:hypothetical protein
LRSIKAPAARWRPFPRITPLDTGQRRAELVWETAPSVENKMLAHLPIIILTSLHPTPVADELPNYEIARECQSEGGPKETQDKCATDEKQARDKLQNQWIQYSVSDKAQCNKETNADGSPSYVELLICLQMARDAKRAR